MKFNKKLQWLSNIHIYGQSLAIGDAYFLIDKIKAGDASPNYFYNDDEREGEPEGFVNEVKDIAGKTVQCFTLNNNGLSWFPVFDSYAKGKEYLEIDGYYIDYGGAVCTPCRMKEFYKDIKHWVDYDYVVINDELNKCYEEISEIIDFSYYENKKINYDKDFIKEHVKKLTS